MRQTKDGWKPKDFDQLYLGFGFTKKEGANHTLYVYKKYNLVATVARHNDLATGYAATAVKLIDQLLSLQEAEVEATHEKEE